MIPNIQQAPYDPVKDFVPVAVVTRITWVQSDFLPMATRVAT